MRRGRKEEERKKKRKGDREKERKREREREGKQGEDKWWVSESAASARVMQAAESQPKPCSEQRCATITLHIFSQLIE